MFAKRIRVLPRLFTQVRNLRRLLGAERAVMPHVPVLESALRHLDGVPVFHWHSDAFDLPEHGLPLAATPDCPTQAFALGPNLLGLQFHPEVTARGLENWYVGHYRALGAEDAPKVADLREQAERHAAALRESGTRFLREWLAALRFE